MNKNITQKSTAMSLHAKALISGSITGISICLILFVIMALILSIGSLPMSSASIMASVCCAVGAFFSGRQTAKILKKNGLLYGLLCGFILFLVFSFVSLLAFRTAPSVFTLLRLVIFTASSAFGGIIGVGSADKRKIV